LKKDNLGYTEDFKNVDEKYGTLAGFTEAVKKLKDVGLRVLLTLVPNHSSTKHKWFTDDTHQYHDYYVHKQASDVSALNWRTVNNNRTSAFRPLDTSNISVVYLQQFDGSADLNYLNEKVVNEMTVSVLKNKLKRE
jgi:glycosidase